MNGQEENIRFLYKMLYSTCQRFYTLSSLTCQLNLRFHKSNVTLKFSIFSHRPSKTAIRNKLPFPILKSLTFTNTFQVERKGKSTKKGIVVHLKALQPFPMSRPERTVASSGAAKGQKSGSFSLGIADGNMCGEAFQMSGHN